MNVLTVDTKRGSQRESGVTSPRRSGHVRRRDAIVSILVPPYVYKGVRSKPGVDYDGRSFDTSECGLVVTNKRGKLMSDKMT